MLICNDCNNTFAEDEIASWKESRGEFWGMPCYETMQGCPYCNSCDFDELIESEENENDG